MRYVVRLRQSNHWKWFNKSYHDIVLKNELRGNLLESTRVADALWEKEYGFYLGRDKFNTVNKVIFPSEAEATLFILRWS